MQKVSCIAVENWPTVMKPWRGYWAQFFEALHYWPIRWIRVHPGQWWKAGRRAGVPGGCVTTQRSQERLQKQVNWNTTKFHKEKCKLTHLCRSNHRHQNVLSSPMEKDLGILCMRKGLIKSVIFCITKSSQPVHNGLLLQCLPSFLFNAPFS